MSEVLEGTGGLHNGTWDEEVGYDEEEGGCGGGEDDEFTLESLRNIVVNGLR